MSRNVSFFVLLICAPRARRTQTYSIAPSPSRPRSPPPSPSPRQHRRQQRWHQQLQLFQLRQLRRNLPQRRRNLRRRRRRTNAKTTTSSATASADLSLQLRTVRCEPGWDVSAGVSEHVRVVLRVLQLRPPDADACGACKWGRDQPRGGVRGRGAARDACGLRRLSVCREGGARPRRRRHEEAPAKHRQHADHNARPTVGRGQRRGAEWGGRGSQQRGGEERSAHRC